MEPFCNISFAVESTDFYKGCIIPITIKAGEGTNKQTQVQLYINEEEMGFVQTSPFKYYWHTENVPAGYQTIKAVYTTSENKTIIDEQTINLLETDVNCPGEVVDVDGNIYMVVQIGNQCWMQTNLKITHYPDGEPLISGIDSLVGGLPNDLPGWYFAYNRDSMHMQTYGYLYTWTTVMKGNKADDGSSTQGICPDGWHVPNVDEWRALIDFSGGIEIAGSILKDTNVFNLVGNTVVGNSIEFYARPGGCRVSDGSYIEEGNSAYF